MIQSNVTHDATATAPLPQRFTEDAGLEEAGLRQETSRVVIPIVAEELTVGKRVVETETLRVHKSVEEREETVDVPLWREEIFVETVAVNREVTGDIPTVRQEGETMIIPVLREELIVRKALFLAEEIHVRRERWETHTPQTVTLRRETAHVERTDLDATNRNAADAAPPHNREEA